MNVYPSSTLVLFQTAVVYSVPYLLVTAALRKLSLAQHCDYDGNFRKYFQKKSFPTRLRPLAGSASQTAGAAGLHGTGIVRHILNTLTNTH